MATVPSKAGGDDEGKNTPALAGWVTMNRRDCVTPDLLAQVGAVQRLGRPF